MVAIRSIAKDECITVSWLSPQDLASDEFILFAVQLCRVCKQEEVGLINELIIEMEKRNEGLMTLGVLGIFEK